jgi:hypothetical protein
MAEIGGTAAGAMIAFRSVRLLTLHNVEQR